MGDYLLDSTVIVNYLRGRNPTVGAVKNLFSEGSSLGCCPVNIIEIYAGAKDKERKGVHEFLDSLEYYELTRDISISAGEIINVCREQGITLSLPDAAIAAVAMANNLTLLTDNRRHYPTPELKVEVLDTAGKGKTNL